ncbi:MAG: hypothetical protein VXX85_02850 [Candidatus Margulisiibacteriota bacterium]|nr:hypothetical protein [Candidatus Margulisiibacteriota bacterium]
MSIQSAGNVQPNISTAAFDAKVQKTKDKAEQTANGMKAVMTEISELSQELKNQQSFKTSSKEQNSKLETQTNKSLEQLKQQTEQKQQQVQSQSNSQQAQMGKGAGSEVIAEAIAGLLQEEELGETDDVKQALEEKMEILMKKAEELQDVELADPDSNFELKKLFENVDKFKGLKRREENLDKQLEDLEISLKEQETRETLSKLPVDETTKKIREQIQISYENQQNQDSSSDDQPQSDSNDESHQQESTDQETDSEGNHKNEPLDEKKTNEDYAQNHLDESRNNIVSRIPKKSDLNINDQKETS